MIRQIVPSSGVSVNDMDEEKIVMMKRDGTFALLTKDPSGQWFFTDMLKGGNVWPVVYHTDPRAVVKEFVENGFNKVYQFDTNGDFINWLCDNVPV